VATPTEINLALRKGLAVVKFFPAEAFGGVQTLQAIAAPYGMLRFIPTGGITAENLGEYLRLPAVIACGGSWMASKSLIAKGDFETITALSRAALELARQARRR
jgi:2-dehydro-3-deoxyphosphogluconate aldolase/(4S)-4-hydroxy-2-oxoglutarate aldolase